MKSKRALRLACISFLIGMIWGFLISPIKQGICVNVKLNQDK